MINDNYGQEYNAGGVSVGIPQAPGGFIAAEELIENIEAWRQRKMLCEDVDYLEARGGMPYLYQGLQTDPSRGIDSRSIDERSSMYGTNAIQKDPPASKLCLSSLLRVVLGRVERSDSDNSDDSRCDLHHHQPDRRRRTS